ncbi:MAG: uracil-DNA glycosylase family protein [Acidimicrobiales bacterium]|nr:uracil-DNA glycosylase family protein [Acidimicrobiales bacterium]
MTSLSHLLEEVRACRVCEASLEAGPRPIVQVGSHASVVIIGQAPGRRVHESGVPWDDPSGVRLRGWLGLSEDEFYDPDRVALIPMGFCYPGKGRSGDLPPRPECAPLWHERLLAHLPEDRLQVIIGQYAQARYLPDRSASLTETVRRWEAFLPDRVVMPHPSPRNVRWLGANPWFEAETVPAIRARVKEVLAPHAT